MVNSLASSAKREVNEWINTMAEEKRDIQELDSTKTALERIRNDIFQKVGNTRVTPKDLLNANPLRLKLVADTIYRDLYKYHKLLFLSLDNLSKDEKHLEHVLRSVLKKKKSFGPNHNFKKHIFEKLKTIRKSEERMREELDEVTLYWKKVSINLKKMNKKNVLPRGGLFSSNLSKYNTRPIISPFKDLDEKDIRLIHMLHKESEELSNML